MADLSALDVMPAGIRANLEAKTAGEPSPRRMLDIPASMTPRVLDGHWKKLLVFAGSDFLPAGAYHFEGSRMVFAPKTAMCCKLDIITVIDPLDGTRWTCAYGDWEKAG